MGLGASLQPLDIAVNVALPAITRYFNLPLADVQWLVICYVLVYGSLMLVCGKLGDLFGHRLIFRVGLLVSAAQSKSNLGNNFSGAVSLSGNNDWGGSNPNNFLSPHGFESFNRVVERKRSIRTANVRRRRVARGLPPDRQPGEGQRGDMEDDRDDRFEMGEGLER